MPTSANTAAGVFLDAAAEPAADPNAALIQLANESAEPDVAEPKTPAATETPTEDDSTKPETGKEDATIEGNGQVPPGQHEDEDGHIVNNVRQYDVPICAVADKTATILRVNYHIGDGLAL